MNTTVAISATTSRGNVENLATDVALAFRYNRPMADSQYKQEVLRMWLLAALERSKLSQAELGRRLEKALKRNLERSAVNKMAKGRRKIAADELIEISKITGYPTPLTNDDTVAAISQTMVRIKVKGYVQAGFWNDDGEWVEGDHQEIQISEVSEYPGVTLHACRVRGDSMDKLYADGTILVWVNIKETQERPVSGKRYIVRRTRNDGAEYEMTVKTYIKNSSGEFLIAESNNPRWGAPIKYDERESDEVELLGRVVRSIREE